ncbi:MAG TPA: hypothetical protein VKE40_21795 [Gemmataceae bacterium]|nr:hypothetical protein [Gemmataceae bacterium]
MLTALVLAACVAAEPEKPFAITVVDAKTGRGVPLIELRTVNHIRLVTDSNGIVAFREPGLMNETVFFHVSGHGYEYPKDGFGFRGKQVKLAPGGSVTVQVDRINIAERLYRVTGAGIYRDSVLTGAKTPIKEPLLNARVFGSDSVMNAVYRDKVYWFWGDTLRPEYPLGNFHVPGATSEQPGKGGLDPDIGIDLSYFLGDKGFAKATCEMPGKGPTWLTSLVVLPDKTGRERMCGSFVKVEPPLKIYARGLAIWDDEKSRFDKLRDVDVNVPIFPQGHAFKHKDGDREYVYFATPYPLIRVPATAEAFGDPDRYEAFTCLKQGTRLDKPDLDRDAEGRLRFAWRGDTPPVGPAEQAKLAAAGKMKAQESPFHLRDRDTGKPVLAHAGSVSWNEYRKRWTMIAVEQFGKPSLLGEVWYAEADDPTGPWRYAVKVVSHDRMSFYNPKQHALFAKGGGRVIYFEGTYTHDFSGNPDVTPRYEYNQVMYRLDLGDPRVALPRPVPGTDFLALDRSSMGAAPLPGQPKEKTAFYMISDGKNAVSATVPLFEFTKGGEKRYAVAEELVGFTRGQKPVGRVWRASGP